MNQKFTYSIVFFLIVSLNILSLNALAQSPQWGNDVNVFPVDNEYYKDVRVAIAYDGTAYLGRLTRTGSSDAYRSWQVYKSTNNGATWTLFCSGFINDPEEYSAFDIIAAGENESLFRLYVARATINGSTHEAKLYGTSYTSSGTGTNLSMYNEGYTNYSAAAPTNGYISLRWATDSRMPSSYSSPYTINLVAAKRLASTDSIIAWSCTNGGSSFLRQSILGSSLYIERLDASIGVCNDVTPKLGIIYETHSEAQDTTGKLWVTYRNAGNLAPFIGSTSFEVGASTQLYSHPTIALSQVNNGSYDDIRTIIVYESVYSVNDKDIYFKCNDYLFEYTPDFSNTTPTTVVNWELGMQARPHLIYDSKFKNFLLTYYDKSNGNLPYLIKGLTTPDDDSFFSITNNYRDANTTNGHLLEPRVDMNIVANQAAFGWANNDRESSLFDAEYAIPNRVIEQSNRVTDLLIFPNPAKDLAYMKITTTTSDRASLQIMDINGRLIHEEKITLVNGTQQIPINTSTLSPGNYMLRIFGEKIQITTPMNIVR